MFAGTANHASTHSHLILQGSLRPSLFFKSSSNIRSTLHDRLRVFCHINSVFCTSICGAFFQVQHNNRRFLERMQGSLRGPRKKTIRVRGCLDQDNKLVFPNVVFTLQDFLFTSIQCNSTKDTATMLTNNGTCK